MRVNSTAVYFLKDDCPSFSVSLGLTNFTKCSQISQIINRVKISTVRFQIRRRFGTVCCTMHTDFRRKPKIQTIANSYYQLHGSGSGPARAHPLTRLLPLA